MRPISLMPFALSFVVACAAETNDPTAPGPLMRPGEQCLSCHRSGGTASGGPPNGSGGTAASRPWSVAGTVFPSGTSSSTEGVSGAVVVVTDSAGKTERLTTNDVGNFYTATPFAKPLRLRVEYAGRTAEMPLPLDADGACNACHSYPDPIGGAAGRIRLP